MKNTWLFHCLLPLLIACGSREAPQSQEMQEAVRLFEASHHLYDSLNQVRIEISQSQLVSQDTVSLASWQAWQSELDQWHEDMVPAGTQDHDHSDGHDHDHHHHEAEIQVTDQQMLEIQQEQWQTIQKLAKQLDSIR